MHARTQRWTRAKWWWRRAAEANEPMAMLMLSEQYMRIDMRIDMCIDICIDMRTDMCTDMCVGMRVDMTCV